MLRARAVSRLLRCVPLRQLGIALGLMLATLAVHGAGTNLTATYAGVLMPTGADTPVPISIELIDLNGLLAGKIRTDSPLKGSGSIDAGSVEGSRCTISAPLSPTITLRLQGTCQPERLEGSYTLYFGAAESRATGSYRLQRKADNPADKRSSALSPGAAGGAPEVNLTACLRSQTACLSGCPRGDYNVEFLCANRCRSKYQICKGKGSAFRPLPPPGMPSDLR